MGIQALDDTALRRLGRLHSVAEARAAFDVARANFDRISFDLIYARQDQSLHDWELELREGLAMASDHLSLYQLTIEDGTAFGDRFARGRLRGLPADDLSADMYALTQDICEDAGLSAYEVSNHARPGSESRHNLIYWRAGDYAGIGPGAHGRLSYAGARHCTVAPKAPGDWLQRVEREGLGETPREPMSQRDHAFEYLMMVLRLREGIDLARYEWLNGKPIKKSKIKELVEIGMIGQDDSHLWATAQGRMVLNAVITALAQD